MSRPNKSKLKTKRSNTSLPLNVQSSCTGVVTEKVKTPQISHSLNLQSSSVALQNANLDHSQLTSHALNRQSPSTAAGSAKLKPSETSVSLDLQNTSLTTEPAITNPVAIETPLNNEALPTAHHQNKPQLLQLSHRKIRSQYRIRRNLLRPLQTSDQLLHSSPTSKACLLSNVVREDPHLTST